MGIKKSLGNAEEQPTNRREGEGTATVFRVAFPLPPAVARDAALGRYLRFEKPSPKAPTPSDSCPYCGWTNKKKGTKRP